MCRFVIVLLEMAGSKGGGGGLRCQNVVPCTKNYEII